MLRAILTSPTGRLCAYGLGQGEDQTVCYDRAGTFDITMIEIKDRLIA